MRPLPYSVMIAALMMTDPAAAQPSIGGSWTSDTPSSLRQEIGARRRVLPVKDCTRFNGRYGYYGNPWCTEREQLLWDLYSSGQRPRTTLRR